ncbi:MAG: hypothetical protein ACJ8F7_00350 [Gemmataceae bacterium]
MIQAAPRHTAAQVIVLAADDLMAQGASEFSEWDLTLASWNRDRNRFGLRGFAQQYPDHKRVMMEIMGRKPHNPIFLGLMEKVRKNTYRLTALGRAEAARLRGGVEKHPRAGSKPAALDHYDQMKELLTQQAFTRWRDDPDEPRRWADVLTFLGAEPGGDDAAEKFRKVQKTLKAAMDWCNERDVAYLTKDPPRLHKPIPFQELSDFKDFLQALTYRFPRLEGRLPQKG